MDLLIRRQFVGYSKADGLSILVYAHAYLALALIVAVVVHFASLGLLLQEQVAAAVSAGKLVNFT